MCLYIDCSKHAKNDSVPIPKVAKADKVVYKAILNNNESYYQNFKYKPNKRYTQGKRFKFKVAYGGEVEQGFHAFRNKAAAIRAAGDYILGNDYVKVVKFIIPAGAKYFIGWDNDIVSDTIIAGDLVALK